MSNVSSFLPEHVLTKIQRLAGLFDSPKYERLMIEEPDGVNPRRPTKYTYKIYASISCVLLFLFLCFKGTGKDRLHLHSRHLLMHDSYPQIHPK